jgi:glycosyltransferase involved in cell wall biosynthesis
LIITYVLLSPTFGMHQYAADLANRMANGVSQMADGRSAHSRELSAVSYPEVALVTTRAYPRDRYSSTIRIKTPLTSHGTGFSREGLDLTAYRRVLASIYGVSTSRLSNVLPIIHFTGVHAWNVPLVYTFRRRRFPVIHTLHDLNPHGGVRHGRLIGLWNQLIIRSGCHLLVHGRCYREELLSLGLPGSRVTQLPLLHGFWKYAGGVSQMADGILPPGILKGHDVADRQKEVLFGNELYRTPLVLFFGRIEVYKGVDVLLAAWESLLNDLPDARLVLAGPVATGVVLPTLPLGVELRDRRIEDDEAFDLFRSASLLVLPYRDATQSALIAAAYTFNLPVIVTKTGALPEYVVEGETGWVVPPADPKALTSALRAALANPARLHAVGQAGRAWYNERRREEEEALAAMYEKVSGSSA